MNPVGWVLVGLFLVSIVGLAVRLTYLAVRDSGLGIAFVLWRAERKADRVMDEAQRQMMRAAATGWSRRRTWRDW